jgi:hypothetical protein
MRRAASPSMSSRADFSPMPLDPPVISALLFVSRFMIQPPENCVLVNKTDSDQAQV